VQGRCRGAGAEMRRCGGAEEQSCRFAEMQGQQVLNEVQRRFCRGFNFLILITMMCDVHLLSAGISRNAIDPVIN
jgi:hypothetical protein